MKSSLFALTIGLSLLMTESSQAAEIKAFVTGAARRSYDAIVPQFEKAGGHKVTTEFGLPPALIKKLDAGEAFDVLILSYDVEGLIKQGKLVADSRTVLGRTAVGVAIRQGAPKPDFSTVEKFKAMLVNAKSFATSGQGSSGRYVDGLIDRLGISEVKAKIKSGDSGSAGQLLSKGEVDFVVSGLPPLIGVPNIEWLGEIPAEINSSVVFTGGINVNAKEPQAARALLQSLTTPSAIAVWKENGLEPAR